MRDSTWGYKVKDDMVEIFHKNRENDRDRQQNVINHIFPQLSEARDQYIKAE
jgi:hypothetical protein